MIEIPINNNRKLVLVQSNQYGNIDVMASGKDGIDSRYNISAGDMTLLLNYYRYVKSNDVKCDFINPYGK